MLSLLCAGVAEIVVGIVVAVILVGGFGGYIAYKIWAKKHGKCGCGCDCGKCSSSGVCPSAYKKQGSKLK
ncbi:MAG: hypothetical protein K2I46_07095 [Clostridia bacterium]|nr:hypothetical protein [Clostridia bacterium]